LVSFLRCLHSSFCICLCVDVISICWFCIFFLILYLTQGSLCCFVISFLKCWHLSSSSSCAYFLCQCQINLLVLCSSSLLSIDARIIILQHQRKHRVHHLLHITWACLPLVKWTCSMNHIHSTWSHSSLVRWPKKKRCMCKQWLQKMIVVVVVV
jgi:hypothetical protein